MRAAICSGRRRAAVGPADCRRPTHFVGPSVWDPGVSAEARVTPARLPPQLVYPMLDYGGARARGSDLFGDDDPVAVTKRFFKVSGSGVPTGISRRRVVSWSVYRATGPLEGASRRRTLRGYAIEWRQHEEEVIALLAALASHPVHYRLYPQPSLLPIRRHKASPASAM